LGILISGSVESRDEAVVQSNDNRIIKSNFDRRTPSVPIAIDLMSQQTAATTIPIVLAATE